MKKRKNIKISRLGYNDNYFRTYFVQFFKALIRINKVVHRI
jgi:hypothetical protein